MEHSGIHTNSVEEDESYGVQERQAMSHSCKVFSYVPHLKCTSIFLAETLFLVGINKQTKTKNFVYVNRTAPNQVHLPLS